MECNKPTDYFDWIVKRLAWAGGAYWQVIDFAGDGTRWHRLGLGFYWRSSRQQAEEE